MNVYRLTTKELAAHVRRVPHDVIASMELAERVLGGTGDFVRPPVPVAEADRRED
jgi:hypothetical protein